MNVRAVAWRWVSRYRLGMRILMAVAVLFVSGCVHGAGGGATTPTPGEPLKLPVSLPGEVGRLAVLDTFQTPASSTIVLDYTNDSGRAFRRVRLECVLIDHRGTVANTGAVELRDVAPGLHAVERLRIVDSVQGAVRAECSVAYAVVP